MPINRTAALLNRGFAELAIGERDDAIRDFRKAVALDPRVISNVPAVLRPDVSTRATP
jgi:hypothetical protein